MDSPLAFSVAGEVEELPPEQTTPREPEPLPWPPTALYEIPVARSFAEVGQMLSGSDLKQSPN